MIIQSLIYKCDFCENEIVTEGYFIFGNPIANPHPPDGWRCVDNNLVCDNHAIKVELKPTEVEL